MELVLSTHNPNKVNQVKALFQSKQKDNRLILVRSLTDFKIEEEDDEAGETPEENAERKAWFAHKRLPGRWVAADDTVVCIKALNEEPGVHSARWAGPNATTEAITRYALKRLKGFKGKDRSARFFTVVHIISPRGKGKRFYGEVYGRILEAPRGELRPGMPYSRIFVPDGSVKTYAEMTLTEENAVSHRGKAFNSAFEFFREYFRTAAMPSFEMM